jgi:alanine racemase
VSSDLERMRQGYSAWVDVDLDDLLWNYALICKKSAPAAVIPVIKGNALGFGIPVVSRALAGAGAKLVAVSNFNEALEIRRHRTPIGILTMNGLLPIQMELAARKDITFFVFDEESIRAADECGRALKKKVKVHVKIDSGLGRLGFLPADALAVKRALDRADWLDVTGVASHLASPYLDRDREFTLEQRRRFAEAASIVDPSHTAKWHLAASSGILRYPETHFDAVRTGCLLHGLSRVWPLPWDLKRHATYRARIVQVKDLPCGHNVGYMRPNRQFSVSRDTRIAVIPIGSHDGLTAAHADKGLVLVHGKRCRILGLASCEMMVDVSDIDPVMIGDEVVVYGKQGDDEITAFDCGAQVGSSYGITTSLHRRVPRVYWKGGKCVAVDVSGYVVGLD